VWDPRDNINGGAKYLGQMMDRFKGDIQRAVASYNAGPGAVEKHGGVPPYRETQTYVTKVMDYLRYFEQQEPGDNDED
jgi:soluble lytic murein transglycosylase-like protein